MSEVAEKKVQITDLHFELNLWINELDFYKEEIKIFNHRLEDIVSKNRAIEVMQELEHFQNQYIRQIEVIDELRHEVKQHENALEREEKDKTVEFEHALFKDQQELRDQVDQFKKIYYELRGEFMQFLSRWM